MVFLIRTVKDKATGCSNTVSFLNLCEAGIHKGMRTRSPVQRGIMNACMICLQSDIVMPFDGVLCETEEA